MWRNNRQFTRMLAWLTHILFMTSCMPSASNVCWAWLFVLEDVGLNPNGQYQDRMNFCSWAHSLNLPLHSVTSGSAAPWPGQDCIRTALPPAGLEPFSDTFGLDLPKRGCSPTVHRAVHCNTLGGHACCPVERRGKAPEMRKERWGRSRKGWCHLRLCFWGS